MGKRKIKEILNISKNDKNTTVRLCLNFLSQDKAMLLFTQLYNLKDELFVHDIFKIMGKTILSPRLTAAFGVDNSSYTYAGTKKISNDKWPEALTECKQLAEELLGCTFNYALVNIYETGDHYIGWHSDSEKDIVKDSTICSVSIGEERSFQVRLKYKKGDVPSKIHKITLTNGSLCTMENQTQTMCKHRVPKNKKIKKPRINITFRLIKN